MPPCIILIIELQICSPLVIKYVSSWLRQITDGRTMWSVLALMSLVLLAESRGHVLGSNVTCERNKYPPPPSHRVPEYIIDLDLPPEQRWLQLASQKKATIVGILAEVKKFLQEFHGGDLIKFIDEIGERLDGNLPSPYKEEMAAIANVTGLPVGEVVIYNIFYEIFSVCTSIVAQDDSGRLYHVRNLDFGLFMGWDGANRTWALTEVLRPAVVVLDWHRGGKSVYKSVNFAGYIGILTAIKQNKFTFSMDERFNKDGGYMGILEWIRDQKGAWMGFLSRETMETAESFQEARDKLANTQMIAPAYFILGGTRPGEGCVITRNRTVEGTDVWGMRDRGAGGFFVLETNYDHWRAPLIVDNRRDPAIHCMQNMGHQNVGLSGLFNVLSSRPVLNKLTTYSALMQVDTGHFEAWLQYCPDPCDPW